VAEDDNPILGGLGEWQSFQDWSIDPKDFRNEGSFLSVDWNKLIVGHLKVLVSLLTALYVTAIQAPFEALLSALDGVESFVLEAVNIATTSAELAVQGSFSSAVSTVQSGGAAGLFLAIGLFAAAFLAYTMVVNALG
jgi:hypothetical protein